MRVGMMLSAMHPWEGNELFMGLGESMGLDSLWTPDHIMGIFHPELWSDTPFSSVVADPDALYDPFCVCAALGRQTEIPLGMSVTDATRRAAPDVARSTLTLQHMCKGGFHLGVGSGEAESLVPFGYPFDKPVGRTEEFLKILRVMLDTGEMPGDSVGRTGIPLESEHGRPKVWVAGHGPRMLRLTGEYGDGWLPCWPMSPGEYGERRKTVAEHAARVGRLEPESGLVIYFLLGESRDRVAQMMEEQPLSKLFALFAVADIWERHGVEHPLGREANGFINTIVHELDPKMLRDLAPRIPVELMDEMMFMGGVDEITERVAGYAAEGLEHLVLGNLTGIVGGMEEIQARIPDFLTLAGRLREL